MNKKNLLLILATLCLSSCQNVNDDSSINDKVSPINITYNQEDVEKINARVNDVLDLKIDTNQDSNLKITWSSSDESIVYIDENGTAIVVGKGTCVITATVKNVPYITDSIFIEVSDVVVQDGVGSGKSKDDPIFLGNEGEDEPIEVYFLEMSYIYGDCIFIKKGDVEVLIDSGWSYDGVYVSEFLSTHCNDGILDVLMASHGDGDHIDGFSNALKNIDKVSLMIDYGGKNSGSISSIRNKYIQSGTTYHSAYDCVNKLNDAVDRYYLTSEFYVDILNTGYYITENDSSASNPNSLATIFTYKDFSFFTAGDITTKTEESLLKKEQLPEVTLYKASHHGSNGSNSQEILNTLNPKGVAISSARADRYGSFSDGPKENNTFNLNATSGHPFTDAISRIYKAPNISQNLNVYWNVVNGTMKFVSYGTDSFEFEGSATRKGYYDLTLTNGNPVWNDSISDFENKVTGEENYKLHETKAFLFRNYISYLPTWAQQQYF